ncbi:MAG: putative quinol monooxygenase [Candidatus Fimadaptatus sp.]
MAITVNIYYTGRDGSARSFAREMTSSGIVSEIRAKSGNLRYEHFFPMHDEETVLLIDSWQDQRALDMHHASPLMPRIAALRDKYDLHMRVERYISDAGGIPASDRAFIRE